MQNATADKITFADWQKTNRADAKAIRTLLSDAFYGEHDRQPNASELVALCDEVVNRPPEALARFIELAHHEQDMDELYRFG